MISSSSVPNLQKSSHKRTNKEEEKNESIALKHSHNSSQFPVKLLLSSKPYISPLITILNEKIIHKNKRNTAIELAKSLEEEIRKHLKLQRKDYDSYEYEYRKKIEEMKKKEEILKEMKKDIRILEGKEKNREDGKSRSTQLEKKIQETHVIARKILCHEHIKRRTTNDRIGLERTVKSELEEIKGLQHHLEELARQEVALSGNIDEIKARLNHLKHEKEKEIMLWKKEKADCEKWEAEKQKFRQFYNKQLEIFEEKMKVQRETRNKSDRMDRIRESVSETRKSSVDDTDEEEENIDAEIFFSLGLTDNGRILSSEEIIQTFEFHSYLESELIAKNDIDLLYILDKKSELDRLKASMHEYVDIKDETTDETTGKHLFVQNRALDTSITKAKLNQAKADYQEALREVEPIKENLRQLIYGVVPCDTDIVTIEDFHRGLAYLEKEIAYIMKDISTEQTISVPARLFLHHEPLALHVVPSEICDPSNIRVSAEKTQNVPSLLDIMEGVVKKETEVPEEIIDHRYDKTKGRLPNARFRKDNDNINDGRKPHKLSTTGLFDGGVIIGLKEGV